MLDDVAVFRATIQNMSLVVGGLVWPAKFAFARPYNSTVYRIVSPMQKLVGPDDRFIEHTPVFGERIKRLHPVEGPAAETFIHHEVVNVVARCWRQVV